MKEGQFGGTVKLTRREERAIERAVIAICDAYNITGNQYSRDEQALINSIYDALYDYCGTIIEEAMEDIARGEYDEPIDAELWMRLEGRRRRHEVV